MSCIRCFVFGTLADMTSSEPEHRNNAWDRKTVARMTKVHGLSNMEGAKIVFDMSPALRKKFASLGISEDQILAPDIGLCKCLPDTYYPGAKEASKSLGRYQAKLARSLHFLNWKDVDNRILLMKNPDADTRSLSLIFRVEKDRCNRGNLREALSLLEENKVLLQHSAIFMRSLVTLASIYFLLGEHEMANHWYHVAMMVAIAFPETANINSAYLKVMFALHVVLHQRHGENFGDVSETNWRRAQAFFEMAAEEHMRWSRELEKDSWETGHHFASWVLSKLAFTLLRSCVKGHSLASEYRPPEENLTRVYNDILPVLKEARDDRQASARVVVGYYMLKCDLYIRMAQYGSGAALPRILYKKAGKCADKAKKKACDVRHLTHKNTAHEIIDRRLEFIRDQLFQFPDRETTLAKQRVYVAQGEGTSYGRTCPLRSQVRPTLKPISRCIEGLDNGISLSFPSEPSSPSETIDHQTYPTPEIREISDDLQSLDLIEEGDGKSTAVKRIL